jgi:hypothetical protein
MYSQQHFLYHVLSLACRRAILLAPSAGHHTEMWRYGYQQFLIGPAIARDCGSHPGSPFFFSRQIFHPMHLFRKKEKKRYRWAAFFFEGCKRD